MKKRLPRAYKWTGPLPLGLLLLAVPSCSPSKSEMGGLLAIEAAPAEIGPPTMQPLPTPSAPAKARPPIDVAAPSHLRTATFALG